MKNLSFKAQRAFTNTFGKTKMTFDRAIRIGLIANLISVGTGVVISKGYEDPPDEKAAMTAAYETNAKIDAYAADQRSLIELKSKAQSLLQPSVVEEAARKKQLADIAQETKTVSARASALTTTITTSLLQDATMGEENAAKLAQKMLEAMPADAPSAILKPVENAGLFLNECRVTFKDNASISNCLIAENIPYVETRETVNQTIMAGMLGTIFGLGVFGIAAGALRPRVERQEKKIIEEEFKTSVDSLRDMLAPTKTDNGNKPKP